MSEALRTPDRPRARVPRRVGIGRRAARAHRGGAGSVRWAPVEEPAMSPRPLRKDDLTVLRAIARAQPSDYPPDEEAVARLVKAGLIAQRRGRWGATDAGKALLEQRKADAAAPPAE
jgi:hypothetical protein